MIPTDISVSMLGISGNIHYNDKSIIFRYAVQFDVMQTQVPVNTIFFD